MIGIRYGDGGGDTIRSFESLVVKELVDTWLTMRDNSSNPLS